MKAREKAQDPSAVKVHISHLYTVINKIILIQKNSGVKISALTQEIDFFRLTHYK